MSWLRLDDGYDTHPKLLELTEQQRWRWTRVLIHCARHKTEGHVKTSVLRELGLSRTVTRLLNLGLLESNGEQGYLVHDWSTFNPKDPTKAERQARWRAKQVDAPVDATVDGGVDGPVDDGTVHSRVGARARPVPSRPLKTSNPVTATQHAARAEDTAGNGHGEERTAEELEALAADVLHQMPA